MFHLDQPARELRLERAAHGGDDVGAPAPQPRAVIEVVNPKNYDEVVPYGQSQALRRTYCRAGVPVTWKAYWGEHVSALILALDDIHSFMVDRINGRARPGNC